MTVPIEAAEIAVPLKRIGQANYADMEPDQLARAIVEWLAADDWCENDGSGYCGNHDAQVRYTVSDFGPDGRVLTEEEVEAIESGEVEATAFDVCSSAYHYRPELDR